MSPRHPLESLFAPRSIAVVGASERPDSVGQVVFRNLRVGGYAGELYAVNRKGGVVQGAPAYPSVSAIGRAFDLVLVAVPADAVAGVIEDCGRAGVRCVIVLSAGFAESGPEGAARQAELVAIARSHGMRLLGPNCVGVVRPSANVHAYFGRTLARPGRVALISQSGAVCTAILDWAAMHEVGFSAVASIGAAADVGFGDLLDYLADDAQTDAILLYAEGVDHARRFMSGLRVAARMKPVIVLRAGRNAEGSRAAASHTGALVGDDAVFDCALRRAGALRVMTLQELFSAAELLASGRRTRGNRLAIITNAGGLGVMAADRIAHGDLLLASLRESTLQALDAELPAHWSHANPVDLIGDASPARYARALELVLADPGVDGALVMLSPQAMTQPGAVAEHVIAAGRRSDKPLLTCFMGGMQVQQARAALEHAGVPDLPTPEAAVDAFSHLASFERNQRMLIEVPGPHFDRCPPDLERARAILAAVRQQQRNTLSLTEAKALLAAFAVPVTASVLAASSEAACDAATRIGFPVALKLASPDVSHKTDVSGVQLGLATSEAVASAFKQIEAALTAQRPQAVFSGVTVESMHGKRFGRELLVGIARDRAFGPVIVCAAGGTLVELIADRSVALPPLNATLARDMIERTRVARMLGAWRHMPAANLDAVQDVLLRLSQLACELPEVYELDINPLVVDERGAVAVDARVVLGDASRASDTRSRYAHVAIEPYPADLTRALALDDGVKLLLRPIKPEDAAIERAFVRNLSSQARYFRFQHGLSELTARMLVRFTQIDYDREMAFIAVTDRDGVEEEVAVGRYVQEADGESCEFALVVADAWQGRGIGTALMHALIDCARARGLLRMYGEVLIENTRMLELVRKLGFNLQPHAEDPNLRSVTLALNTAAVPQAS